ncbi:MAG TPA: MotA/TolQ/ExbB proton channel family protein [Lacunisphaera sp.]|nr:MotA/TolQ/ExbB proton channel family protein [Lacunisphaera sp.]
MPSLLFSSHLASLNVWQVFLITDRVGQAVIALLAVFSIFAWALMMGKYSELKKLRALNFAFERRLGEQRHILDLPENLKNRRDIPYADLLADALEAYWRAAAIGKEKGDDTPRGRLEHAENAIQRALARQSLRYEASMIILASLVSGAPFMGLFGTVWGIMEAFQDIASQGQATLATVAPGIAEALVATAAGLFVAIPAVVAYNMFAGRVKRQAIDMDGFSQDFLNIVQRGTHGD